MRRLCGRQENDLKKGLNGLMTSLRLPVGFPATSQPCYCIPPQSVTHPNRQRASETRQKHRAKFSLGLFLADHQPDWERRDSYWEKEPMICGRSLIISSSRSGRLPPPMAESGRPPPLPSSLAETALTMFPAWNLGRSFSPTTQRIVTFSRAVAKSSEIASGARS